MNKSKLMRKMFCMFLSAIMLIPSLSLGIQAITCTQEKENIIEGTEHKEAFSETDVLVSVALHVRCEPMIDKSVHPIEILPLYNLSNEIIAYDVTMSNGSYFIVNANKDNPMIIEFADSRIQTNKSDDKKYYLAPGIILEKDSGETQKMRIANTQYKVFSQSAELLELQTTFTSVLDMPNEMLARQHSALKSQLENHIQSTNASSKLGHSVKNSKDKDKDKDEYDFLISEAEMPSGSYSENLIPSIESIKPFGTTSEFNNVDGADNHCASTSAFNMVLYYRYIMNNPIASSDRNSVFTAIHQRVKNGPVTPSQYRSRIESYIRNDTSYNITVENIRDTWDNYKNEIDAGHMTVMCVWPSLFSAHMINGVGTREYSSGTKYCVVLNNWWSRSMVYTVFGTSLYDLSKIYIYN